MAVTPSGDSSNTASHNFSHGPSSTPTSGGEASWNCCMGRYRMCRKARRSRPWAAQAAVWATPRDMSSSTAMTSWAYDFNRAISSGFWG